MTESKFHPFVLPFILGLTFLVAVLLIKYTLIFRHIPLKQRTKARKAFFSIKFFPALWEVIMECLLHRKIFKRNIFLGYMHMSFAFGWFILIAMGNLESRLHHLDSLNPPWFPIFYKFFNHNLSDVPLLEFFHFTMDFVLLSILLGLLLAFAKRAWHRWIFGMKKTTKMIKMDRVAMTSLWCIFPFRLAAESITAGIYHNGGFLVGSLGNVLARYIPPEKLEKLYLPGWWAYSIALGVFFVSMPWSRYLHIVTEAFLIFLRHCGVKDVVVRTGFSDFEVLSCPRCGICIDACQLSALGNRATQAVYYLRTIRNSEVPEMSTFDCLMCGRCMEVCPVGIDINKQRAFQRQFFTNYNGQGFQFGLHEEKPKTEIIYFAGCMTHLTPAIKKSVIKILDQAGVNYNFMDENEGICCGRPLMLSGKKDEAMKLVEQNTELINNSGAETLVTSCPICYKIFREEYKLNVEVMHHSQYILGLVNNNRIKLNQGNLSSTYHDPCDLGRGSGIYDEPRTLIEKVSELKPAASEKEMSLCCGGSLGSLYLENPGRTKIARDVIQNLTVNNPDQIITACPLCKKTLTVDSDRPVRDISEIVAESLIQKDDAGKAEAAVSGFEKL